MRTLMRPRTSRIVRNGLMLADVRGTYQAESGSIYAVLTFQDEFESNIIFHAFNFNAPRVKEFRSMVGDFFDVEYHDSPGNGSRWSGKMFFVIDRMGRNGKLVWRDPSASR